MESLIQTSIESTTTPLNEIYFPTVTICNINQVFNFDLNTVVSSAVKMQNKLS